MEVDYSNSSVYLTETERKSIQSSLNVITSTPYASVPYMRNLGLKKWIPEDMSDIARNEYITNVIEQAQYWEDRVEISEILFDKNNEMKVVVSSGGD